MNNDMTAVAVERLSAQIGQAIFGEPMTHLIELANGCNALQVSTVKQSLTAAPRELREELLDRANGLEREAAGDREKGESIEQAIDDGEGYTPDDPTDVADEWMAQFFVPSLYSNMTERGDRLLEEMLELLQARNHDPAASQRWSGTCTAVRSEHLLRRLAVSW